MTTKKCCLYLRSSKDAHDVSPAASQLARSAAAALASAVMWAQSPASIASFGVSHEPPTQATFLQARKAGAVSIVMPPVGQNVMSDSGPRIALPRRGAWTGSSVKFGTNW